MSRNRVRRSFTVETKARGRQAPAILPVRAPLIEQPSPAFPSLEAAALFGGAPTHRADEAAEPAGRLAPRRILPNLIAAPVPEPEAAEPVTQEPRLPRVRRVALKRAKADPETARPERAAAEAPSRPAPAGIAQPQPAQISPPQAKLSPAAPPPASAEPVRRALRRPEKALPLGERWKRRLPRVCW